MAKYVDLFDAVANYFEEEGDGCILTSYKQNSDHTYFIHQEDLGNGYQEIKVYQLPNAAVTKVAKGLGFEGSQCSFDDNMYKRFSEAIEKYRLVTFD